MSNARFKLIVPFINPVEWIKAYRFKRQNSKFDKSLYDMELHLYSKILNNKMLHWGYFEDPSTDPVTISLKKIEEAQIKYAQNIIDNITNREGLILDVGCGMGGLTEMLKNESMNVEALTPNINQVNFLKKTLPDITCHCSRFEDFNTTKKYTTVINSESLQYIPLDQAFAKIETITQPGSRWIVVDYFKRDEEKKDKRPHSVSDFKKYLEKYGWTIETEKDITMNVLPTIGLINILAERLVVPLRHYIYEKFRYKKAGLFYLSKNVMKKIDKKIEKERHVLDPDFFVKEKKYMFFVLEKK